eukprot:CAMPEP_0168783814 /NCGR_PEP_ID=MMETSP0725-20121227/9891_1 /TAXON_ID=265536 /ORGANISM="Amphiprora sp., Strain CCMP467" /LENGTH=330 /DNA_ID=CAMNT_0008833825 /DNA_START=624 /DNA_END=1616 /DNA_ORIENTATION=+
MFRSRLGAIFLWALLLPCGPIQAQPDDTPTTNINNNNNNDDEIMLEDFRHPQHDWTTLNDPVMGGRSYSTLTIDNTTGIAHFVGRCAVVPFLHAPGFITMVTGRGFFQPTSHFRDVSTCGALKLVARRTTDDDYDGYFVSFGTVRVPGGRHASGYKAPLPQLYHGTGGEFREIIVPFANFSSKWDETTGRVQVSCRDDARYCPDIKTLQDFQTLSLWGEGVEGDVDLEIQRISAVQCASRDGASLSSYQAFLREQPSRSSSSSQGTTIWIWVGALVLAGAALYMEQERRKRHSELRHPVLGGGGVATTEYESIPGIQLEDRRDEGGDSLA